MAVGARSPTGGLAPLTAQALRPRRGSPPGFKVTYHVLGQIWKLATALEWGCRERLTVGEDVECGRMPNCDVARRSVLRRTSGGKSADRLPPPPFSGRGSFLIPIANRLNCSSGGNQNTEADVTGFIDALRIVPFLAPQLDPESLGWRRIVCCFYYSHSNNTYAGGQSPTACSARNSRPMRRVSWTAHQGDERHLRFGDAALTLLVDLPAWGLQGTFTRRVTSLWVREQCAFGWYSSSAIGQHLQDADAQLLQESGFLNRLISRADKPADHPVP